MGSDKQYIPTFLMNQRMVIPVYQRNYDWKVSNCRQLFNDLYDIIENDRNHFLGAIVYTTTKDGRIIIDGQQRLTSISLLFIALRDSISDGKIEVGNPQVNSLLEMMLYMFGTKTPLLEPVYKDKEAYDNLLSHGTKMENSNLVRNYNQFVEYICEASEQGYEAMTIYNAVTKMWFMPIPLDSNEGDDPQAVFESINTTGLSLSDADCIRNYIMMNRDFDEQKRIHRTYWYEIEQNVGDVTIFFRDYLTSITAHLVNMGDVYLTFKKTYPDIKFNSESMEKELKEILIYAKIYRILLNSDNKESISKTFHYMLNNINHMGLTVVYPFLLNVLRDHESDRNILSTKDVDNIAITLNNYLIRRSAAGYYSTGLNKIMESLYRNIKAQEGEGTLVEKMRYIILSRKTSLKYPDDDELRESLNRLQLYKKKDLCDVALTMIEYYSKDQPYLLDEINVKDGRSIEHIMPQDLTEEWKEYLGDDAEKFHSEWKHRVGNLTLTSYNSEYSNHSYPDKWSNPNGFEKNTLFLNSTLTTEFKQDQLKKRNEWMIDQLIKSIPFITSTYSPPSHVKESPLGSMISTDLKNKEVFGFRMEDVVEENCTSAKNTFVKLIKEIYSDNSTKMDIVPDMHVKGLSIWFKHEEKSDYQEISKDLYLCDGTTYQYFDVIQRLLKYLNLDPYGIVLFYKPKK